MVIGALATFLVLQLSQIVYVGTQYVFGRMMGAHVQCMGLGIGPTLFSRRVNATEWRLAAIPLGAYTVFQGCFTNDSEHESDDRSEFPRLDNVTEFQDLPVTGRILLMVVGPLGSLIAGTVLLWMPIAAQAPQLVVDSEAAIPISPSSVPDLGVSAAASSPDGQIAVVKDTFIEFWAGLHIIRDSEGWGGIVSWLVTCGRVATETFWGWSTCCGITLIAFAVMNLLPLPTQNGGKIILMLMDELGVPVDMGQPNQLVMLATVIFLISVLVGSIVLDGRWLFNNLVQSF